jgi:hypothetical protein
LTEALSEKPANQCGRKNEREIANEIHDEEPYDTTPGP